MVGLAGAFAVGRLLQGVFVQTSARDPTTIAAVAIVMVAVALNACFWPAWRATRCDLSAALRRIGE